MPTIRFTGMASGLDTEAMVKELMKAQKEPMNRLIRQKQSIEWKRDAYREMNTLLLDLRSTVDSLRFSANFNQKLAVSENDDSVAAKVVGQPTQTSYAVKVVRLAEAEMPASVSLTVDPGITDTNTAIGGSDFTLKVNGTDVAVAATDTLQDIMNNIKSATGMKASFVDGKIWITSSPGMLNTGETFTVSVGATDDGSKLGMPAGTTKTSTAVTGQDAEVVINGVTYTSKTNKITVDGVEFTLKQVGPAINVTNEVNEDAIFNTIKGFVDKYNEIIDKINKKISEPKYKGYEPLLDEEKEAIPERTAEKLENMAKSGVLLRDSILTSGLHEMRRALSTALAGAGVNAAFDTLQEIGIGGPPYGKYAYQENGKLYIDESKLRAAIRDNGEEVKKLFTSFSSSTDPATKYKESGVAERLYSELTKVIDKLTSEAGSATSAATYDESYLGKRIEETDDEIDRWKDRLKQIEDRYYKQFANMEKMMAQAQSQSSWFAQLLGQQR